MSNDADGGKMRVDMIYSNLDENIPDSLYVILMVMSLDATLCLAN